MRLSGAAVRASDQGFANSRLVGVAGKMEGLFGKDRSAGEATWEPIYQFKEAYSEFQLMDTFFGRQYTRKKKWPTVG
jgi:hypothetical protein